MTKRAVRTCESIRTGWKIAVSACGLAAVILVAGVGSAAAAFFPGSSGPSLTAGLAVGSEVVSLRTADSRTFVGSDGTLVAHVYQGRVNYQDAAGAWHRIDNRLVSGPAGFTNAANRFRVELPRMSGSAPVRVSDGSRWVSFSLDGATGLGAPVLSGSSETYAALPGVNVTYTATGWGLKEDAVLLGKSSPRSLSYSVSTSAGLRPVQETDGSIKFVDASGKARFSFLPPSLSDARGVSHGAAYRLTSTRTGYKVTLNANTAWLASAARAWPVTIDPSLTDDTSSYLQTGQVNPSADGQITSSNPTTNYGTTNNEKVGWDSTGIRHTLEQYSLGLPVGAQVLNAKLNLYLTAESNSTQASVGVYGMTRYWSPNMGAPNYYTTWNKYDTINWTTAGGDYTGTPTSSSTPWATTTVGGTINQYYSWDITQLAAAWASGAVANKGLLLKYVDESTHSNLFTFNSSRAASNLPYMTVTYDLGKGSRSFYSFDRFTIDDSTTASVNEGNGNLLVCQQDVNLPGVAGLGLSLQHCWNSLGADPHAQGGWVMPGSAVYLDAAGTSVVYHGDTGYEVPFTPDGSGGYVHTIGFDAALTASSGTLSGCSGHAFAYKLTFNSDGSKQYFNSSGQLVAQADQNGNAICFNYGTNVGPSSITASGRTISFTYDSSGRPTAISYSSSNCASSTCTYGYTYSPTTGKLTVSTDPTGATTNYSYDSSGNLTGVQDPRGNTTTFTPTTGAHTIWKVAQPAHSAHPTVFTYNNSGTFPVYYSCPTYSTDVTSPNGYTTDYCRDLGLKITGIYRPDGSVAATDYTDTTEGGSNCVDSHGDSLDDQPCASEIGFPYSQWTGYGYDSTGQKRLWEQNPVQTSTHRSTWVYGDSSHPYYPTTFTDADGNTTTDTYTTAGNVAKETDGVGNTTSYTYNSNGTLASEQTGLTSSLTCPSGKICPTTTYNTYDSQGDLTEKTDALGNITTYSYDGAGNQTCRTDGLSYSSSTHTYCSSTQNYNCPSGATCPVTSSTYDAVGRLLTQTDPLNYTTQYTYDGDGNKTSETDGLSYNSSTSMYYCPTGSSCPETSDTYDANNQQLSETDPNNNTTTYTYDADGNQLTETDPDGNQTLSHYDALDQQESVQTGLNSSGACATGNTCPTTSYEYDWDGNRITETDARGYQTDYAYDQADELTEETTGLTFEVHPYDDWMCATGDTCPTTYYTYDLAGNKTTVTDGNGSETVTAYDADNRQHTVTTGLNGSGTCTAGTTCPVTTYTYDNNGNQATVTDPDANETQSLFNADNQVSSVTSGLNSSGTCPTGTPTPVCPQTTYTYDNNGNKGSVTQAAETNTPTTTYTYYADGSLDTTSDPMGNVTTDNYDNAGNLISEQTPQGTTTSCYDAGGELLATYYSAATCGTGTPDVSYTYDAAGNQLTNSTTGTYGQTTETTVYTNLEQPQSVATSEPISSSSTLTGTFDYAYDEDGNVTERTYPDGTNVYYSFDNNDLECGVGSTSGSSCSSGSNYVTYGYDGDDNVTTSTYPSGSGNFTETQTYDNSERLTNVDTVSGGSSTIADFSYALDASGNTTGTTQTGNLNCSMSASLDNNERLAGATYSSCAAASDPSSFAWVYDADGNWTQNTSTGATTTTTYDKVNTDDQICATSTSSPPSSCSGSSFGYDGNGNETTDGATGNGYTFNLANQMTSATQVSPSVTSSATYDGDGNQLSQTTNGTTTYYFWDTNTGGDSQLALAEDNTGTVTARYLYGLDRLSVYDGSTTQYYVDDGIGSTAALVSSSGAVNSSYLYDPYGSLRYSSPGSGTPAFAFAGLRSSSVSNVDASGGQYYDTNTGRFLGSSADGQPASNDAASSYAYAGDQPTATAGASCNEGFYAAGSRIYKPTPKYGFYAKSIDTTDAEEVDITTENFTVSSEYHMFFNKCANEHYKYYYEAALESPDFDTNLNLKVIMSTTGPYVHACTSTFPAGGTTWYPHQPWVFTSIGNPSTVDGSGDFYGPLPKLFNYALNLYFNPYRWDIPSGLSYLKIKPVAYIMSCPFKHFVNATGDYTKCQTRVVTMKNN